MSGPQGSDPGQPWPAQDAPWQAPAYPPVEYPQYQQPAQQYPQSPPGYGQSDFTVQAPQFGAPPQFGQLGQYGQYQQPGEYGQYGQPPYGQLGQYGQYPQVYDQAGKSSKRLMALIGGVVGVITVLFIGAVFALGFWQPGFFVTTKLDVNKAQIGVQQVLTDEANGYGAKNVKDVKCNHGADPTVKKGVTFDCDVSIDGAAKHVTVTFQDNKGTYEVGRPQ